MPAGKVQRVHVVEMAERVAGHHHIHLRGANEEGVEVAAKEICWQIGEAVTQGEKFFGIFVPGLNCSSLLEACRDS